MICLIISIGWTHKKTNLVEGNFEECCKLRFTLWYCSAYFGPTFVIVLQNTFDF